MKSATIALFMVFVLLIGSVLLQIFLSKKKSKWFGLILPTVTLIYSILTILGLVFYDGMTGSQIFTLIVSVFLISNIPTFVLFGIYLGCRDKMKIRSQLDKMNIQDLE